MADTSSYVLEHDTLILKPEQMVLPEHKTSKALAKSRLDRISEIESLLSGREFTHKRLLNRINSLLLIFTMLVFFVLAANVKARTPDMDYPVIQIGLIIFALIGYFQLQYNAKLDKQVYDLKDERNKLLAEEGV